VWLARRPMLGGMKSRSSLPSLLAFGLVLASASAARADDFTPLPAPEPLPTHVRVHIAAPHDVRLESRAPGQSAWAAACSVPCDRELPLADEYRTVYGKGAAEAGKPFSLKPAGANAIVLKIDPPSAAGSVGGGVLIGLGSVIDLFSVVGLVGGLSLAAQDAPCSEGCYISGSALGTGLAVVSFVGLLLGTGVIAGGAAIMADAKGSMEQRPAAGREPTWAQPRAELAPKRAAFVTPLSFSF
jgi:hypothetical protein